MADDSMEIDRRTAAETTAEPAQRSALADDELKHMQEKMQAFYNDSMKDILPLQPNRSKEDTQKLRETVGDLTLLLGVKGEEYANQLFQDLRRSEQLVSARNHAVGNLDEPQQVTGGVRNFAQRLENMNRMEHATLVEVFKKFMPESARKILDTVVDLDRQYAYVSGNKSMLQETTVKLANGLADTTERYNVDTLDGIKAQSDKLLKSEQVQGVKGTLAMALKQVAESDHAKSIMATSQRLVENASHKTSGLPDLPVLKGLKDLVMGEGEKNPSSGLINRVSAGMELAKTAAASFKR